MMVLMSRMRRVAVEDAAGGLSGVERDRVVLKRDDPAIAAFVVETSSHCPGPRCC